MTFSRLTLGDPRLKSKLRGGSVESTDPCKEPLQVGEVLRDPGFEDLFALQEDRLQLGRFDDRFGEEGGAGWIWSEETPEGFIPRDELLPWWATSNSWFLNTTEQRSGSYCVEVWVISPSMGYMTSGNIIPCNDEVYEPFDEELDPAFRADPGNVVTMSAWVKSEQTDIEVELFCTAQNKTGAESASPVFFESFLLANSYAFYEASGVVTDPDTYWIEPRWGVDLGSNTGRVWFDSTSLTVTE